MLLNEYKVSVMYKHNDMTVSEMYTVEGDNIVDAREAIDFPPGSTDITTVIIEVDDDG